MVRLYFNRTGRRPSVSLLDVPIFMLCPACGFVPHEARRYVGSRYGHVGDFTCGACGARVAIVDRDCRPPVSFVAMVPGRPGQSFIFEEVYRVTWEDLKRAEAVTRTVLIPAGERGSVDFAAALAALEGEVARRDVPVTPAPLPGGVTWVPEPLRAWLDALFTLDGPAR